MNVLVVCQNDHYVGPIIFSLDWLGAGRAVGPSRDSMENKSLNGTREEHREIGRVQNVMEMSVLGFHLEAALYMVENKAEAFIIELYPACKIRESTSGRRCTPPKMMIV